MNEPAYLAARMAAREIYSHFERDFFAARPSGAGAELAALPDCRTIERLIDAAFWASLRREEGVSPRISLAYLAPQREGRTLALGGSLPLTPAALVPLAPAVERPGIHLGVWHEGDGMRIWGATRTLPPLCFVLEVVSPGLLVVKRSREEQSAKFVNVAVLEGDEIKILDRETPGLPGFDPAGVPGTATTPLMQLAISMRAHGRGGTLLVVPAGGGEWRESIMQPVRHAVSPPYGGLAEAARPDPGEVHVRQEELRLPVDAVGGLTAVDGATVIARDYAVLAFGAKIHRRDGFPEVANVVLTEPVEGATARTLAPAELGGTRHTSAAQFAHDQRDALALVASQDGRFTVFSWCQERKLVNAHRIETLLL